jgi:hypothetical protein
MYRRGCYPQNHTNSRPIGCSRYARRRKWTWQRCRTPEKKRVSSCLTSDGRSSLPRHSPTTTPTHSGSASAPLCSNELCSKTQAGDPMKTKEVVAVTYHTAMTSVRKSTGEWPPCCPPTEGVALSHCQHKGCTICASCRQYRHG